MIGIPVVTVAFLWILRLHREKGVLSFSEYAIGLVSGVAVITIFVGWRGMKMAPTEIMTSSEKSFAVMLSAQASQ